MASRRPRAHVASVINAAAVSATSTTGIAVPTGRRRERRRGAAFGGRGDEVVAVAVGDERHEELARAQRAGVERGPVDLDVGSASVPPVAAATSDARILIAPNGTVDHMAEDRIHLVVLFGGQSAEHDVSCVTATAVLGAADPQRYRITPIGISREGEWALAAGAQEALAAGPGALPARLDPAGEAVSPDAVLAGMSGERTVVLPLLHGPMGEDGTVQGLLELAGVAYVGCGVLGSALAMDKALAKQVLAHHGIAQARHRAFRDHERTPGLPNDLAAELGLPCFVKPANMGSSVGVTKAHTVEELRDAIDVALTYDEWVVVEEAVVGTGDRGRRARQHRTASRRAPARSCPAPSSTTTRTSTSPTAPSC